MKFALCKFCSSSFTKSLEAISKPLNASFVSSRSFTKISCPVFFFGDNCNILLKSYNSFICIHIGMLVAKACQYRSSSVVERNEKLVKKILELFFSVLCEGDLFVVLWRKSRWRCHLVDVECVLSYYLQSSVVFS